MKTQSALAVAALAAALAATARGEFEFDLGADLRIRQELMKNVPEGLKVEIEVRDFDEGIKAAKAGADIVMADHFPPEEVRRLREALREINPDILVEASGNITSKTAVKYAGCADIVSLGELTHSPRAVHFSMDIEY